MRRTISRIAILLFVALRSNAQLTSRAIVSYQNYDSGSFATTGLRQQYDLRLDKALSEPARFRIFIRAEDFTGSNEAHGLTEAQRTSRGRQIQPGGDFSYVLPTVQAQVSFDFLRSTDKNALARSTRRLERSAGRIAWHPGGLPELSFEGHKNVAYDSNTQLNTEDMYGQAGLRYDWRGLQVTVFERLSQYGDGRFDFARRSQDHLGTLSFEQSFLNGRLNATASANATLSHYEEHAAGRVAASIPTRVSIARASAVVDDTPLDNRDQPLVHLPPLTDGSLNAAAGIALGPDAPGYQNIAFDFNRFAQVDEIRVYTRNSSGNPVSRGGGVQWDVYRSEDGILWSSINEPRSHFDVAQSLYSVTFPQLTARYLKIVSFGVEADPTFVTETEAYYHTLLAPNEERTTDATLYSATAALSYRPARWIAVGYEGLFNSSEQSPSDRPALSTQDADHVATVEFRPWRNLSLTGRFNTRSVTQSSGIDQTLDAATAIIRYLPLPRLDLSLETTRQREDSFGQMLESDTSIVHVSARLLPSVDLRANFGLQKQDFTMADRTSESRFVTATLTAQLTRTLRMLLDTSMQRATFGGSGDVVAGLPAARDDRQSVELYWRAGQPLGLGVRVGRVTTDELSAFTQRYRVEWYPFAQGTVSIGGTYDEDVDPYTDRRSKRIVFSPRWMMNRHAIVDLNYTFVRTTGFSATGNRSLFATLTLMN